MLIDLFFKYIRYEKNLSSHTVLSYKNDIRQFQEYCEREVESFDWLSVDRDHVRNWILQLGQDGLSSRSIARKVSALRALFRFFVKQKYIEVSPISGLKLPKIHKKLPSYVRRDAMDVLLDGGNFGSDFSGVRDHLIIDMFYQTGIRRAELIGLKDADVNCTSREIRVTGKRNKQRIVPIGSGLVESIAAYRDLRDRTVGDVPESFFVRESGEPLYPQLVYRAVKGALDGVCTLDKKSPHVLRHTFASAMLNDGAELNSVKELLGHDSLSSTEVYTHITFEELKNSYNRAHPRAIKKGGSMEIRIQSIHFDASEQLQAFVQKKVSKLEQYFDGIIHAEVILKVVKPETSLNKEASVRLSFPGSGDLFSEKVADTFEEAIDLAADALVKQLQKTKEKTRAK